MSYPGSRIVSAVLTHRSREEWGKGDDVRIARQIGRATISRLELGKVAEQEREAGVRRGTRFAPCVAVERLSEREGASWTLVYGASCPTAP